jgi:ubiquinone/menaquinone biosynthesis C-methylase UbiE
VRKEKQVVKEFYDNFGWHKNAEGVYKDSATFVDRRSALQHYYSKTDARLRSAVCTGGTYYLNAGSGANAFPGYSSGFTWHVCVDFSMKALVEARSKLRDKGLYVLADMCQLPFKEGVFDVALCSHVLYHIPGDEQASTVRELLRVMKRRGKCVIVYSWPTCLLTDTANRFRRFRGNANDHVPDAAERPALYAYSHNYKWFRKTFSKDMSLDMRCWRSIDIFFSTIFIPNNFFGRFITEFFFLLERIFPHAMAFVGRYAMIIIRRR